MARAHARGEEIPGIIVKPGETVTEVRERGGYAEDGPSIVRVIVEPGLNDLKRRFKWTMQA